MSQSFELNYPRDLLFLQSDQMSTEARIDGDYDEGESYNGETLVALSVGLELWLTRRQFAIYHTESNEEII